MRGAIILLLILLMGFLATQSLEAHGYTLNAKDTIFLQSVYSTIDTKDIDASIQAKFVPYLSYFPSNSREAKLLERIYNYTQGKLEQTRDITKHDTTYSNMFIALLGRQF